MKGCKVAALGARVLKDFSSLQKASAEEICKVDMSYFGRIEIQRRYTSHNEHVAHAYAATHAASQTVGHLQNQHNPVGDARASIEPAVSTGSYLFPSSTASRLWQEADESWLHMLDTSMLDSNMADDWSWFHVVKVNNIDQVVIIDLLSGRYILMVRDRPIMDNRKIGK